MKRASIDDQFAYSMDLCQILNRWSKEDAHIGVTLTTSLNNNLNYTYVCVEQAKEPFWKYRTHPRYFHRCGHIFSNIMGDGNDYEVDVAFYEKGIVIRRPLDQEFWEPQDPERSVAWHDAVTIWMSINPGNILRKEGVG